MLGVVELPPQLPANGLIAYYNFDGNVEDDGLNGFGNSLSSEHLSFGPDRFGRSNSSVCFNGYSSIARTAPNSLLTNGEVSVSLWAYLKNSSPATLFNRFNNSTNSYWDDLSFFPNYPFSQKSFLVCNWSGADGNPLDGIKYIKTDFPVKQWFHFAMTVSKTNCILYANGVEIGSMNNVNNHQGEIFQRLAGWSFGAQATTDGPGTVLNGCLDDAAVYRRTLTGLEVSDIYQMQKGPTAAISQAGNSAVVVTFGLYPGYTFQIQGSSDGGNNWVDVETSFVAIEKTLAKTFNVTSHPQLFRAIQVD